MPNTETLQCEGQFQGCTHSRTLKRTDVRCVGPTTTGEGNEWRRVEKRVGDGTEVGFLFRSHIGGNKWGRVRMFCGRTLVMILEDGIETRGRDKGMLGLSFSSLQRFPFYHEIGCFVQCMNPDTADANQKQDTGNPVRMMTYEDNCNLVGS
ncbi:unnamed protein product [Sphenostylis stenocarpa]|uniref:Uncharacterized protein n=1 Tax=Sphenostylis stenocarpa TaxID=92480 RepID=A0AA86SGF7_9FABA|nr:unnamed protein product [Sphenostylis stenocarpa]